MKDSADTPNRSTPERDALRLRHGVIWALVLAVLLFGIAFAIPNLRSVVDRMADASWGWLVLGVALELASCLGYVGVVRLVLKRGPAPVVRRLAWAEMAFGAVVPVGGAGGLAVGAWVLRARGASWSTVADRSAVIFLLTSAVNALVLGLAGIGVWLGIGTDRTGLTYGLLPGGLALAALAAFMLLPLVADPGEVRPSGPWHRTKWTLHQVGTWVRDTQELAFSGDWRLIGAPAYLLCDIAVLWVCLRAVGVHAPVLALIVGYQIGYLANLLPIPGSIGVLEGGLLGALVLYKLPVAPTAAAVILYHAIALWTPTLGGTWGFISLRRSLAGRSRAPDGELDGRASPAVTAQLTSGPLVPARQAQDG